MSGIKSLQRILDHKIVAVIRAESGDLLVDVAESLLAGGVEVMEVTFTVPRATRVLEKVADRIGSSLVDPKVVAAGDLKKIESLARQYVQIVKEFTAAKLKTEN